MYQISRTLHRILMRLRLQEKISRTVSLDQMSLLFAARQMWSSWHCMERTEKMEKCRQHSICLESVIREMAI